jgi:branched-chain amino acid transport system permease protein
MGISVSGMALFSFALASAIGAAAGIVIAPATSLQFDTGMLFTIFGFIAVVIGGTGSLPGAVAGGLLLGVAAQLSAAYISSLFSNALSLGLLLAVLLFRPGGLLTVGRVRRQDVREEPRVQLGLIRIGRGAGWAGGFLLLALALVLPRFLPAGSLLDSFVITFILFIGLLGLNLLMGYGGQVSLGQAGFMAIGGYTAGYLAVRYDVPPLLGMAAGAAISLLCALVLALITMRLRGLYLALATLAFGLLVDSVAVGLDRFTGGPSGMVGIPPFSVAGVDFGTPLRMYYLSLALLVVCLLLVAGLLRSDYGRALQAIRTDQTAAAALGINVPLHKLAAFAISAVFASVAGSLYAFDFNFLAPEMVGTTRSLELVTMMIIGGEGTLVGPFFGAALLTLLPTAFQALSVYKTFANGLLLVVFFLYLPEGIFGGAVLAVRRLFGRPPALALERAGAERPKTS